MRLGGVIYQNQGLCPTSTGKLNARHAPGTGMAMSLARRLRHERMNKFNKGEF